jgi:hypothetical protein
MYVIIDIFVLLMLTSYTDILRKDIITTAQDLGQNLLQFFITKFK